MSQNPRIAVFAHFRGRRSGFTLAEILVSVLIMGILIGIAIPMYLSSESNSQEQACQANMSTIFQAEESYRAVNRTYTTNLANLTGSMPSIPQCPCGSSDYIITTSGSGSTLSLTITCPNSGAHVAGKSMSTSDGQTFSFQ